MRLRPDPLVAPADIERSKHALVQDGGWANVVGVLSGGVILVGLALALDAGPFVIGLLAALPFFGQLAQLPAIGLIERVRQRRKIAVLSITGARVIVLALALLPFVPDRALALDILIAGQVGVAILGAVGACAWNSWMHDLLPKATLGAFFARRLFLATALGLVAGLISGGVVDYWPWGDRIYAYSALFAAAAAAGFVSSWWLAQVSEPVMGASQERMKLSELVRAPLRDANFRQLVIFMTLWNFAVNLAAPFFAVYFIQQLGFELGSVVVLWAVSQVANVLTLRLWGQVSDRLSNKAILGVAAPVFVGCFLALPFTALPARHGFTFAHLVLIHVVMGAATAGIGLAIGNIGLKLAKEGAATAYLACLSLFGSLAAGIAPIVAGALASWFAAREFAVLVHWAAPGEVADFLALRFRHWEFLFAIAFALGLVALHWLARVREGEEVSERAVVQHLAFEARRSMRNLSSVSGIRVATMFPFGRLAQEPPAAPPAGRPESAWSGIRPD